MYIEAVRMDKTRPRCASRANVESSCGAAACDNAGIMWARS